MRLSIFSRLMIGYLCIFALVVAMIGYAIFQLGQFDRVTRSILKGDNRIVEIQKRLTDSLLSQMRYESKYTIIRDEALYRHFLLARDEFQNSMEEILKIAEEENQKNVLGNVRTHFDAYQKLVGEEVQYIRTRVRYGQAKYKEEKEKAVDRVLEDLDTLAANSQRDMFDKIRKLGREGTDARRVAIGLAVGALLGIILISFFITRSITRPVDGLIEKTREIGRGVFASDLQYSSPPEMKELARAFNLMCDQLRTVDEMKSDFFASMSHELRTPLSSIKEGTNLLLEEVGGAVNEKQKKILKIMAAESKRMIDLVNSSLDLSKMEAGMMIFQFGAADITPLLHQAVLEIKPLAMAKGIAIGVECPPNLPAVQMDRERILQVLRNFLGNAVKFTPEKGQITVTARNGDGKLEVRVVDTGCGIPAEDIATIFDKFYQGPIMGTSKAKGTGLGLALARHIITAHGGKVWAESKLGHGSAFIFVLPA